MKFGSNTTWRNKNIWKKTRGENLGRWEMNATDTVLILWNPALSVSVAHIEPLFCLGCFYLVKTPYRNSEFGKFFLFTPLFVSHFCFGSSHNTSGLLLYKFVSKRFIQKQMVHVVFPPICKVLNSDVRITAKISIPDL